jgi:hypothetical protein
MNDQSFKIPTRLFDDPAFRVGALLKVVFYAGVVGFFLVVSIYLQSGQGFSTLGTGLASFVYSIDAAITASSTHSIAQKIGEADPHPPAATLVLGMLGMLLTTVRVGTSLHVCSGSPMILNGLDSWTPITGRSSATDSSAPPGTPVAADRRRGDL